MMQNLQLVLTERQKDKNYVQPWHISNAQGRFVCVEVLPPSQPSGVMSTVVSLPNHTFTGQA